MCSAPSGASGDGAGGAESFCSVVLYVSELNLEGIDYLILPNVFEDKTHCDEILDRLFKVIIKVGVTSFSMAVRYDNTLTATNFLKRDKNYYAILGDHWMLSLREEIGNILDHAV